jgi:alpha-L-fucosidase 2
MDNLKLWYKQPAKNWTEALPLGNGHIGAMVYGGTDTEKIDLTENTCYSGEASDFNSQENASMYIHEIREALFKHDYKRADELSQHITGRRLNYGTNLPFGNLILDFENQKGEVTEYTRELQLDNALSVVKYKKGNVQNTREFFISHPNKVVAMRVSCSDPGMLDFNASVGGWNNPHSVEIDKDGDMVLNGHAYETIHSDGKVGVAIHGRMRVIAEKGTVSAQDNIICVKGADSAVILLAIGTDFVDSDIVATCKKHIDAAAAATYEDLKSIHIKDHQSLFSRVKFELQGNSNLSLPTDQRLNEVKKGGEDPALMALMFQYGRYLLMSSSREDSPLPAHLQGIWNDYIACSMGWTCDMHLDINTEMNYWPTEVTNLSECGVPLFNWVKDRLLISGKQTAKNTYGLDGWVAHVLSNAFGYSAPGWGLSWGLGVTCGMWIATHLWEHYQFTGDKEFLSNKVYPVYREALKFFLGYLTKDPESGYYLSGPSISPENCFMYDWNNSIVANVSMGTVCDTVIIRELFKSFISTCELLDIKDDLLAETKEKLEKLPPFKIGRLGQLQEWFYDFDEPDPHHRHTAHMLSVFPFSQITPEETPELAQAARVTIKKRTSPEWAWEDTGWARSLLINYTARLQEAETFYTFILEFQRGLTNDNLLSFCPPGAGAETNVFEMDGTTGLCSGIAEALMQSHNDTIRLLPSLPEKWDAGSVKGLRARGGYEVSMEWKNNELTSAEILAENHGICTIKYKDKKINIPVVKGKKYFLDKTLQLLPSNVI